MKKICIVGAGAVGGFLGTRLAAQGHQVSALARGDNLSALVQHGWRLRTAAGEETAPAIASDRADQLGVQDIVIITVKAPALPAVADVIAPLIGPHTLVVPAMNGVPWWFCKNLPGFEAPLSCIDKDGRVARAIPYEQLLGCVVHFSVSTAAPGVTVHKMGQGLIFGEPAGGASARVENLAALFAGAGFDVTTSADIRYDIWYKLWGNMTMNPISALTGATGDRILADPLVRAFCCAAMEEASAIGRGIGCHVQQSPEQRLAVAAKLGAFKTSMLQDVESGRPIELDALVGAVAEIGQRLGLASPNIDALMGLGRLFGQARGLYQNA